MPMLTKNEVGLYEAEIDGHHYEMAKWGAQQSLDTLFDLSAVLGQSLAKIFFAAADRGDSAAASQDFLGREIDADVFAEAVEHLSRQLVHNRAMVMGLFKRLATADVLCNGKAITSFDLHYKDRLPHLMRVIKTALEVQYGDFFGAKDLFAGLRRPATPTASPTAPTASTG